MEYPKEFLDECKACFPDWEDLHQRLDAGSTIIVGRYLDDSRVMGISPDKVLESSNLDDLKELASVIQRRNGLYRTWCELYDQQYKAANPA